MSLPTLYHSPVNLFECLTTKPDGFGSIMATCHFAIVECERFTAKEVAAVIAAKLALWDEIRRRICQLAQAAMITGHERDDGLVAEIDLAADLVRRMDAIDPKFAKDAQ